MNAEDKKDNNIELKITKENVLKEASKCEQAKAVLQ